MKKIKSLFVRKFENHRSVETTSEVTPGCEWVLNGEGVATRKWDGTCTLIENGVVFRRYDCKKGKTPPNGFIPTQDPDPITGHWPGWVKIDKYNPIGDEKFFCEGYVNTFGSLDVIPESGTYELCGPKINNNPENFEKHIFIKHGVDIIEVPRNFNAIRDFLKDNNIEGIVFHRGNGVSNPSLGDSSEDMCKIKRIDFNFVWNGKTVKR